MSTNNKIINGVLVTEADRQKFRRLMDDGPNQNFPPYDPEMEEEFEARLRSSINPRLLREGQEFFRRNLAAVMASVFMSIFLGFGARSILGFLFRTGQLVQKDTMEIRSLRAYMYLFKWLEDADFCSDDSPSLKFLAKVRRAHFFVQHKFGQMAVNEDEMTKQLTSPDILETADAIQKDLAHLPGEGSLIEEFEPPKWDAKIALSQFDMAMVQMGLMWCAPANPILIGIGDKTGFSGYLHLMEVVGRGCLVKDEFNVALHYTEGFEKLYVDNLYLHFCRQTDAITTATRKLFHSISPISPIFSFNASAYLVLSTVYPKIDETRKSQLYGLCSWLDRLIIFFMRLNSYLIAHVSLCRMASNWLARKFLFSRFEKYFGPQNTTSTRRAKQYAAELGHETVMEDANLKGQ